MECKCLRFVLFLLTCNNFSLAVVSSHSGRNDSRESIANTSWSSDGVPDFPSLCPYNKYCTSSPLKHIPSTDLTPCCQKCSCDVDCYEIGNCCPDAPFPPAGKLKYPCVRIYDRTEDNLDYSDDNVWYHVIAKCKDTFNALAYPRCYKPTELQDLVVVSNPENGRVYKNKHCATCNDVHNYTNWILKTDCPNMLLFDFKTIEDRDRQIFENRDNCTLYSIPPDSKAGEMSRCSPDSSLITTCNVTWDWDVYDKGIEDACHSNRKHQNVLFTQDLYGSMRVVSKYANVYCYMCNRQRNLKRIDLCIHDYYDKGSRKVLSLEFTGIIDLQTGVNQEQDFDCKPHEVWDSFSKICRHLTCPGGTFPLYGSCKSILSQSEGYLILIRFEVITNNLALPITNETILTILEKRMLPMFGHRCRLAESVLMNVNKSLDLILSLKVYSTETCPTETILANTRKMVMKKYIRMKLRYKDQRFQLLLRPDFSYSLNENVDIFAINSYHTIRYVHRPIRSSIVYYCPSIKVTREEISSFGLNNVLDMTSAKSEENIVSTTICIDTYFKARKTASDTASSHRRNNVLFCFQTLVVLICMGLL